MTVFESLHLFTYLRQSYFTKPRLEQRVALSLFLLLYNIERIISAKELIRSNDSLWFLAFFFFFTNLRQFYFSKLRLEQRCLSISSSPMFISASPPCFSFFIISKDHIHKSVNEIQWQYLNPWIFCMPATIWTSKQQCFSVTSSPMFISPSPYFCFFIISKGSCLQTR